jgi:hypothetical protein
MEQTSSTGATKINTQQSLMYNSNQMWKSNHRNITEGFRRWKWQRLVEESGLTPDSIAYLAEVPPLERAPGSLQHGERRHR